MALDLDRPQDFVSVERGEVDRRIFSDQDIFDQEMELIFGRAWLFLAHESQIPKAGDFFEAPMGKDNVLVVRQKDGSIRAMLNTCTHRGNAVCRAEEGNTKNFMCTYHGWTYALDGELIGVPGFENLYHSDLDKASLGLRQVAQLDVYHGFIFATLDPTAPPLVDYLGATGRLGIDLLAVRGDLVAIPGVQKFVINCNWKFAVDNLFDWYHPAITHMSAFQAGMLGPPPRADAPPPDPRTGIDRGGAMKDDGSNLEIPNNGGESGSVVVLGEYGHAIAGPAYDPNNAAPGFTQEWRTSDRAKEMLGPVGLRVNGHPNIFPNSWITGITSQICLRVPVSPNSTELWWYSFVPEDAPPPARAMAVFMMNHVFGAAGLLEQEDGENWAQATMQTEGLASRKIPQQLKMNLGRGHVVKEDGLARIDGTTTEHAQLWTYAAWVQYMSGADWDTIQANTQPPDLM